MQPTIFVSSKSVDARVESTDLSIKMVEPYTLAWFLSALAAGAISWVGGKIMDSIFSADRGLSAAALIQLIEKIIRRALSDVLSEYDITLLKREYDGLIESMIDYGKSGGRHRLDNSDTVINKLIVGFRTYGDRTAELLASAEIFKVLILQEYVRLRVRGARLTVKARCEQFITELSEVSKLRLTAINSYYGSVTLMAMGPGEGIEVGFLYKGEFWTVHFCPESGSEQDCLAVGRQRAAEERESVKQSEILQRHTPIEDVIDALRRSMTSSGSQAITSRSKR